MLTVEQLIESLPNATKSQKNVFSEAWIEEHYKVTGKFPANKDLTRLADWLLSDELKDKRRNKVQLKEFPILSKPQIERRHRELSMEDNLVDALHKKKINNLPTRKKDAKNNDY